MGPPSLDGGGKLTVGIGDTGQPAVRDRVPLVHDVIGAARVSALGELPPAMAAPESPGAITIVP